MSYQIVFTTEASTEIDFFKKSGNLSILKKIKKLLLELMETPLTGTGKPEPLKYELQGFYSRRINLEHRIVYEVLDDKVIIHSVKGHY